MSKERIILLSFFLLVVAYLGFRDHEKTLEVIRDQQFTSGSVIEYYSVGSMESFRLKYEYDINGIKYTRVLSPSVRFKYCEHDISICGGKMYPVAYATSDFSKSLINFHREIKCDSCDYEFGDISEFE